MLNKDLKDYIIINTLANVASSPDEVWKCDCCGSGAQIKFPNSIFDIQKNPPKHDHFIYMV